MLIKVLKQARALYDVCDSTSGGDDVPPDESPVIIATHLTLIYPILMERRGIVQNLLANRKVLALQQLILNSRGLACCKLKELVASLLTARPVLYLCYTCALNNNEQTIHSPPMVEAALWLRGLGHFQCGHDALHLLRHLPHGCCRT